MTALDSSSNLLNPVTTTVALLEADFPRVNFWTRHLWTVANKKSNDSTIAGQKAAERGGMRMANNKNMAMRFIEDTDGNVIGGHKAQDIRRRVRAIFKHLAEQPGGPASTWTGYSSIKQQYYYQELGRVFPEVRLCELDWKADKLAIDAYPSWYSTYVRCEEEQITQVTIKSERSDETSTMCQKRSQSPSPLTLQQKKKAKHPGRNSIPIASEVQPAAPVLPSSDISPE
jgi:hypothetical protein